METTYSSVDWKSFRKVLDAYRLQLEYWYVLPGLMLKQEGHFGFPIAAMACQLIDCLSQYEAGILESSASEFKNYLRKHWSPELAAKFTTPIKAKFRGKLFDIEDGADAIYNGIRCGILHEAHGALYTGLTGQASIVVYHPSGFAEYADGSPCPVVSVDPGRLFDAIHNRLDEYLLELSNPDPKFILLRQNFQKKFEVSFGVPISIVL